MPHVTVKMHSGRTEEQKRKLTEAITQALIAEAGATDRTVSVSIEDVAPADWKEQVYNPEILPKLDRLHKKPGYQPA